MLSPSQKYARNELYGFIVRLLIYGVILYMIPSFIALSLNPAEWSKALRGVSGILFLLLFIVDLIHIYDPF